MWMYKFVGMMVIQVWLPEPTSHIYMWDSALEPKHCTPGMVPYRRKACGTTLCSAQGLPVNFVS